MNIPRNLKRSDKPNIEGPVLRARPQIYLGLFFIALATLMYEILLTRIFSVTQWFHFAFVAISIAMFGMTVGALLVYLSPRVFRVEKTPLHLLVCSLGLMLTIPLSFILHLHIPFLTSTPLRTPSNVGLNQLLICLNYVVISIPFVFSGVCVCLSLTRFPKSLGRLYAADLTGAALGCLLIIVLLDWADGVTAVFFVATLAGIGAVFFAFGSASKRSVAAVCLSVALLGGFSEWHRASANQGHPLFRLRWVKNHVEEPPIYEKWNAYSRVTAIVNKWNATTGWGFSESYTATGPSEIWLSIDARVRTPMTAFDGQLAGLDYLKHDVVNIAHFLRPDSKVFVIGAGGGRDILSALVFGQRSVLGLEVNGSVLEALTGRFGDFSGHLDRHPSVTLVSDEARSYIARSRETFDIIQASFADTKAAATAGALIFAENSLYTVEAWKTFLDRLTPRGIFTVSLYYHFGGNGQIYRSVSLAVDSLKQLGIEDPAKHILLVHNRVSPPAVDVGTILVSKMPYTEQDLSLFKKISAEMDFEITLISGKSSDPTLEALVSGQNLAAIQNESLLILSAPTDDAPFFFRTVSFWDVLKFKLLRKPIVDVPIHNLFVLPNLLLTVFGLTLICILGPLASTKKRGIALPPWPLLCFFVAIGLGFMLIEIAQMHQLVIFLGHPVFGLSVVLFTLLLSSGLGSYLVRDVDPLESIKRGRKYLFLLNLILLLSGFLIPFWVIPHCRSLALVERIVVAAFTLFPMGIAMGTAFPLGMKMTSLKYSESGSWFWGLNGAASVCGSVLAVMITITFGISATFWTGAVCYLLAWAVFATAKR